MTGQLQQEVDVPVGRVTLKGNFELPDNARGVVLFAHGSGSSRHSPRNNFVAGVLREGGLGTLLTDLLTPEEEAIDFQTAHLRFDIDLLAERLIGATHWLAVRCENIGYFGSSTGAAAALVAAAREPSDIGAVVSRGGRPDLAAEFLPSVKAPTLLIVGGADVPVIGMNEEAFALLQCEKQMRIVPGATHLFEEPGALEEVARLAREWFVKHLGGHDED
jgi:putative phosphoribosyl transferase